MPYKESRTQYCAQCPHNAQADTTNPAVCTWTPDAIEHMSAHRQQVVRLVQRLQHNDQIPWCNHDKKFRILVVRSVVIALRTTRAAAKVEEAAVT